MMVFSQLKTLKTTVLLKRQGYDSFIDFLKGYSIVCVIINHCMPTDIMDYSAFFFWGVSAVPIFLIIQVFHAYKGGINNIKANYTKIWKRIAWPFLLAELIIFTALAIRNQHFTLHELASDLSAMIQSGGYGPGAYYPWIYLQFALLLPLVSRLLTLVGTYSNTCIPKRNQSMILCLSFIVVSQLAETACSFFLLPPLAYRLLFIRYIFIFYLGFLLADRGFHLNTLTLCFALFCLAFSAYINYSEDDFSPLFYPFVNKCCHWFCYIFIAYLLLFVLKVLYQNISSDGIIMKYIRAAGKCSYDIFLFQMVYFVIVDDYVDGLLENHIGRYAIYATLKMAIPVVICTIPVIIMKKYLANSKK